MLLQGAGAGQLRSMEEKVLVPLQDERQRWDGRAGPVRVPRVCQKGTPLTQTQTLTQRPPQRQQTPRSEGKRSSSFVFVSPVIV